MAVHVAARYDSAPAAPPVQPDDDHRPVNSYVGDAPAVTVLDPGPGHRAEGAVIAAGHDDVPDRRTVRVGEVDLPGRRRPPVSGVPRGRAGRARVPRAPTR